MLAELVSAAGARVVDGSVDPPGPGRAAAAAAGPGAPTAASPAVASPAVASPAVRWGFLGAGWIASRALAPAVHAAAGAELAVVAARDPQRAAALGPARVARDYDAVLADPGVDAVYIALANDAHLAWARAALQAGKAVLCEKPLALTAAEVDTLGAASAATGRLLVEASWYRWAPAVRLAQQVLRAGVIGPPDAVDAGFTFPAQPAGYRFAVERGGGALYDVGCYCISAADWALPGPVIQVSARSDYGPTGVDLRTDLVLETGPDGAGTAAAGTAVLRASFVDPERQWLSVRGPLGQLDLPGQPFTTWRQPGLLEVSTGSGTVRVRTPAVDPYAVMVSEVSARLRGGSGWVLPVGTSRRCAAVLDAARASAAQGGAPTPPAAPPAPPGSGPAPGARG